MWKGLFCFFIKDNEIKNPIEEPTSFENAWYHKDDAEKKKWQDAINLEFNQMMKNEVWNRKGLSELPNGRKGIGTRWIFKIKKDRANLAHKKMLYSAIKFVDHTINRDLVLKPTNEYHWNIKRYSDSDYAGDDDNRRSVSGYLIDLNNCPIAWKSRGQKTVTLYIALSEVSTEIVFISEVITFMEIPISYPIEIIVDNVGAIYLAKNASTTTRTKHIGI
jgi:hypothetical protein